MEEDNQTTNNTKEDKQQEKGRTLWKIKLILMQIQPLA